jgi:Kef-type K+ transport system membrane component KefB
MAPISRRFLIPLFFTSLGTQVPLGELISSTGLLAVASGGLIIIGRHFLHERFAPTGGDENTYLLLCPNFTLVALAANSLLLQSQEPDMAAWILITGLVMTIFAVASLPSRERAVPAPA